MDNDRPFLRLLGVLLLVALPPLIAFAALTVFAGAWLADRNIGTGTQLLIGAGITVLWAAFVASIGTRVAAGEARTLLELVERGASPDPEDVEEMSEAQRRLTSTLDERNRQIADLADRVREAPIAEDPRAVARSMAGVARSLTHDPTWVLVVLRAPPDALPPGVYTPDPLAPPEPVSEVHGWASTVEVSSSGQTPSERGARHAIGPWGAFVTVDVAAGEELRAILMAPWEGRPPPSPAELALFSLLGRHAATAVDHAMLYTRLRAQTDELNRMAAVQTDFLRGITHDLQSPLTSIRAVAAELREAAGLDDAGRDDLDTIAHQADRLRRMVGQLLTVSRLEAGAVTPRQEVFRAEPIIRRTWDALRAERPLDLQALGNAHLVVGDPDRFEQTLWAILDNAIKYSPAGSEVHIRLAGLPSEGGLISQLEVTDQGAGMDATTVTHAFEQFYRSDVARSLAPDGSGIGLYAARGLVEAMGGQIAIDSRLGGGTTITVRLPAEPAASDEAATGGG